MTTSKSQRAAQRHTTTRYTLSTFTLAVITLLQCSISSSTVAAADNNIPKLDFDALGSVAVAGSFAGLELYDASTSLLQSSGSNSASSLQASLVSLDETGKAQRLGNTDGQILAIAQCGSNGDVYFAGNFSTTDGIATRNIGVYYASNNTIAGVSDGLDGPASALACETTTGTLYVGGSFNRPVGAGSSYTGAVASWSTSDRQWSPLGFGGFAGSDVDITTIALNDRLSASKSVVFGGRFDTYWLNETSTASNVTVTTLANGTVAISSSNTTTISPDGAVATVFPSLGSSLVPISLASAEITASTSTSDSRYSDARSIFCPAGDDGSPDSTWLVQDESVGRLTARIFSPLAAGGFRIGNTNVQGRGTQTFSIVAIPTNEVLTLSHRDDPTSASSALSTCSDSCPLSHDPSIAYEDFLISSSNATLITGFQITLSSFYGSSAGLHLLQLLSAGSISYAIDNQNRAYGQGVCASGPYAVYGRSSSTHTPTERIPWDHTEVASSTVAGTSEGMLCAATPVNTDPASAPEATWFPYVAQDGTYDIFYFTPACAFDSTCGQRGFVDVTVQITGSEGTSSTVTTINQEVTSDTSSLIFSGSILPVSQGDQVKVTSTLSSREKATLAAGKGDKYYLIADKVVVTAQNTDGNGSTQIKVGTGANAVNVTDTESTRNLSYSRGYSLWEWVQSSDNGISPTVDVASTAPQQVQALSSATALDQLAFHLDSSAVINKVLLSDNQAFVFLAGDFNYSSSGFTARSILFSTAGSAGLTSSPQGGLSGIVTDMLVADGWLYAVGDFNSTGDGSITGLAGKARCQYASLSARWEAIPDLSTEQQAVSISLLGENLVFTYMGQAVDIWNPNNATISQDGHSLILGNFVTSSDSTNATSVYLGGKVGSLNSNRSSSISYLTSQGIQPISFGFDYAASAQELSATATTFPASASSTSSKIPSGSMALLKNRMRKRQSSASLPVPSTLPASASSGPTDPLISAVAFWHNTSSGDQVTIVGGSFVTQDDRISNLGILTSDGQLEALGTEAVTGSVKALKVVDNILWVGGGFTVASGQTYLAAYDLANAAWLSGNDVASVAGTPLVNAMAVRDGNLVVAGHFSSIAGMDCAGVCEFENDNKQWKAYAEGANGVASSMSLSGNMLFVAGSFVANNTSAYVMVWDYDNSAWTALSSDSLPGPALAITADTETSVFISGASEADTAASYLKHWNGSEWSDVVAQADDRNGLDTSTSAVQQLALVPLTTQQPDSELFSSNDRALLVSGQLNLLNLGQASSAIYDGSSWYPYLLASSRSGEAGSISGIFYSMNTITFRRGHQLAVGLVILISIAIALGIIFLCVLIALIITLSTRRDEPQGYPVVIPPFDNTDYSKGEATSPTPFLAGEKGKGRATPMLETLGAATAAISAGHPGVMAAAARERHSTRSTGAPTSSEDESIYDHDDVEEADDSLPLRGVRYSFDAEREQELSINMNDMVEVLDDSDEHWHIVRRIRDGRQGLVPSAFLT